MAEEFDDDEPVAPESGELDEPEDHRGTHEEQEQKFHTGEKTADPYTEEGREELTEDEGEMTPAEEGFTKGATEDFLAVCAHCGKVLADRGSVIEKKFGDHTYWFCTDKCAAKGKSVA